MYGSIFRMKPKPGAKDTILALNKEWQRERSSNVPGFVAFHLLEGANGDLIGVAIFENEETYRSNADDPAQNEWYQKLRENLEADPEWNDGTFHSFN